MAFPLQNDRGALCAERAIQAAADQLRYRRQIHADEPIIAIAPTSPPAASPRRTLCVDDGDGVGVGVGDNVGVGGGVRGVAFGVCSGGAVGAAVGGTTVGLTDGFGVGLGVGTGVGVAQKNPEHGVALGDADGGGVSCAFARPAKSRKKTLAAAATRMRRIYRSTTRCVSVVRTPGMF